MTKYRHVKPPREMDAVKHEPPEICPTSGKRMYAREADAAAAAKFQMNNKETRPAQLRTYRCMYCGTFHLTSKPA